MNPTDPPKPSFGRQVAAVRQEMVEGPDDEDFTSVQEEVAHMLGLFSHNVEEIIVNDITTMVKNKKLAETDGYVLCLGRFIEHKKAWTAIVQAFRQLGIPIPPAYYDHFSPVSREENQQAQFSTQA